MMSYPKHWRAYLNYLEKLLQKHIMMLDLKELEIRQEWNKKSLKEKFIAHILNRSSVPDSPAFYFYLKKLNRDNMPDVTPRLEGYWTWSLEKKESKRKLSSKEVRNALGAVLNWNLKYMEAARKGDKEEMERLNKEFNAEKLIKESLNE